MTDRKPMKAKKKKKYFRYYVILASILILLIMLAFFTPQIIFQVQDTILCKDTVLSRQENVNAASLSTTYERSLETRMANYAEGLAGDDVFYLASQNLSRNDELAEYFYSDSCIYGDFISALLNSELLSYELWEMEYSVSQWKQYVIYSDNFTKGVNFILWYIELQDSSDRTFKLLADAEDGTIYAIRTEGNDNFPEEYLKNKRRDYHYMDDIIWNDGAAYELWAFYALYYAAINEDEVKDFYTLVNDLGWDGVSLGLGSTVESKEREMVLNALGISDEWKSLLEKVQYRLEREDRLLFQMPYGNFSLDVVLELPVIEDVPVGIRAYPNLTIGIQQIYEMIPEFA